MVQAMENITAQDRDKITRLIIALIPNAKIYLFGSRARGTHSPFSDIDIAIDAGEELPLVTIDEAKSVMAASNLLYHVDVVDLNSIAEDMQSLILQEGIAWKQHK